MSVTLANALTPALPALRLLPVPASEPPYDDGLPPYTAVSTLGPLCLLAPVLRLVPHWQNDESVPAARTPAGDLPPARAVAHCLVQGLLEVLAGVRPLAQLQRRTSVELYAQLEQAVTERPRATGARPPSGAVRSLHLQQHPEGIAEVCATVYRGQRVAAVALRLEGIRGQWCCTELAGL